MKKAILHTDGLSVGHQQKVLLKDLSLSLQQGELTCLIGPNGIGKSTLLHTLCQLIPKLSGKVFIEENAMEDLSNLEIAKRISIVLSSKVADINLNVYDVVSMGRTPYTNMFGKLTEDDDRIITQSLEQVNMLHSRDQNINTLSDGEKQRVMIAKALAQDTPIMILDEPTAHLDINNRVRLLKLLKDLAVNTNKAILLSTHELEMSIQLADYTWLIQENQLIKGTPEDLVLTGLFTQTFNNNQIQFDTQLGSFQVNNEQSTPIQLDGNGQRLIWTKKALEKDGYFESKEGNLVIKINDQNWEFKGNTYEDIYALKQALK